LARYAGDEFVVLIETDDQTEGQKIYGRIREQENLMNTALRKPYDIHFAVGYVTYTKNDQISVDGFLDAIDKKMYADKRGLI
jgi:GGDEF domain-containing protein